MQFVKFYVYLIFTSERMYIPSTQTISVMENLNKINRIDRIGTGHKFEPISLFYALSNETNFGLKPKKVSWLQSTGKMVTCSLLTHRIPISY